MVVSVAGDLIPVFRVLVEVHGLIVLFVVASQARVAFTKARWGSSMWFRVGSSIGVTCLIVELLSRGTDQALTWRSPVYELCFAAITVALIKVAISTGNLSTVVDPERT